MTVTVPILDPDSTRALAAEWVADLTCADATVRLRAIRAALPLLPDLQSDELRLSILKAIRDPSAEVRAAAAEATAGIGVPSLTHAEEWLIPALNDPSPLVRTGAARALATMEANRAADALSKVAASDDDPKVRAAAIDGLSGNTAFELLIRCCRDRSAQVRQAATTALLFSKREDRIPDDLAIALLGDADPAVRREATRLFRGRLAMRASPWLELVGTLQDDPDEEVRRLVATVVPLQLPHRLSRTEESAHVRRAATLAASQRAAAAGRGWEPYLLQIDTIRRATGALCGGPAALTHAVDARSAAVFFTKCLRDANPATKWNAGLGLGECGEHAARAVPRLTEMLDDEDPALRVAAIVGFLGAGPAGAAAVPALVRRLADDSPDVRQLTAMALGGMGPAASSALTPLERMASGDVRQDVRDTAASAVTSISASSGRNLM